jgi:flagellar hook-associated protein 3 FlgL
MRITTAMVQRNMLTDLNQLSERLAKTQAKAASGKQITRASDDPYNAAKAMNLRQNLSATSQYSKTIQDSRGWQDATESSLAAITDFVNVARDLVVQGGTDSTDAESRKSIATQIDQIINGIKDSANASYGGRYLLSGTATDTPPYVEGTDAYQGNQGGLDPAIPGIVRDIGPGVTMTINTVADEVLGSGLPAPADGKLLKVLRDISTHLKADDGAALRGGDLSKLDASLDTLLTVRARNGAQSNRLDSANTRLAQIQENVTKQLSDTEDADFAQTMIEFNQQSVAYQAALKAGANIVQQSLMDFLR